MADWPAELDRLLAQRQGTMFSREELLAELREFAVDEAFRLEAHEFGGEEFYPPESEQRIRAFRGLKKDFENGPQFWLATLRAEGWAGREMYFEPYAESGLCRLISGIDFKRLEQLSVGRST